MLKYTFYPGYYLSITVDSICKKCVQLRSLYLPLITNIKYYTDLKSYNQVSRVVIPCLIRSIYNTLPLVNVRFYPLSTQPTITTTIYI